MVVLVVLALLVRHRARNRQAPAVRARDIFKMPPQVDGFVVARLVKTGISRDEDDDDED